LHNLEFPSLKDPVLSDKLKRRLQNPRVLAGGAKDGSHWDRNNGGQPSSVALSGLAKICDFIQWFRTQLHFVLRHFFRRGFFGRTCDKLKHIGHF